jgi:predicted AAA+ superfamily ATPase
VTKKQLQTLEKPDRPDALFNLVLIGPPGTGKTYIALAIGNKAAREGYKVHFVRVDNLVHILKTQEISRKSQTRLNWIRKCDLLIIDELGFLPVSRGGVNKFFSLISELYENASVIIASNKGLTAGRSCSATPFLQPPSSAGPPAAVKSLISPENLTELLTEKMSFNDFPFVIHKRASSLSLPFQQKIFFFGSGTNLFGVLGSFLLDSCRNPRADL